MKASFSHPDSHSLVLEESIERQKDLTGKIVIQVEPVLKWAGGKKSLLPQLMQRFPRSIQGKYIEPFLGGASVAMSVPYREIYASDSNPELINFYEIVRDFPNELISEILLWQVSEEEYYKIRAMDREASFLKLDPVIRAARTLYLNKVGFNGLFRVNQSGHFNVPFGKRSKIAVDEQKIKALSTKLRGEFGQVITLSVEDFESSISKAESGDFVYLDPPYIPVSSTSSFVGYSESGFSLEDQTRIADRIENLTRNGVRVIMSNSYSPKTLEIFQHLGQIEVIEAPRRISAKGTQRGWVEEIIFDNKAMMS